jgi:hypothetical protein
MGQRGKEKEEKICEKIMELFSSREKQMIQTVK